MSEVKAVGEARRSLFDQHVHQPVTSLMKAYGISTYTAQVLPLFASRSPGMMGHLQPLGGRGRDGGEGEHRGGEQRGHEGEHRGGDRAGDGHGHDGEQRDGDGQRGDHKRHHDGDQSGDSSDSTSTSTSDSTSDSASTSNSNSNSNSHNGANGVVRQSIVDMLHGLGFIPPPLPPNPVSGHLEPLPSPVDPSVTTSLRQSAQQISRQLHMGHGWGRSNSDSDSGSGSNSNSHGHGHGRGHDGHGEGRGKEGGGWRTEPGVALPAIDPIVSVDPSPGSTPDESDSDSSSSNSWGSWGHHNHHHGDDKNQNGHSHDHHSHDHGPPDDLYMGSLGYGYSGDSCMYQQLQSLSLSQPCQQAVQDLHSLRSQYWNDTMSMSGSSGCHFHAVLLFLVVLVLGGVCRRARAKKVNAVLQAIHANPELKAAVEAHAKVQVPKPCCGNRGNPCVKILKVITLFMVIMFTAFFTAVFSVIVASNIIASMAVVHEDGSVQYPSAGVAISILLLVVTVNVLVVVSLVRVVRRLVCPRSAQSCPTTSTTSRTSRTSTSGSGSDSGSGCKGGQCAVNTFFRRLCFGPSASSSSVSDAASRGDYVALGDAETGLDMSVHNNSHSGTEMVTVTSMPPATPFVVMNGHHQQQQQVVYVPVSAAPLSSVSMI